KRVRHRLMTHPLFYAQAATLEVSKSKQEELDNYDTMLSDLFFLSGFKGTTFLNPPIFRGINLQKIFKVDNKSPFTECRLC
ncbi:MULTISPECIES: hypothetical protein, partial [Prevotellaceae]|uniref:hypothetical protein n=1 Tax=Prevotellaceae TaxID=171552 RepID=UPI001C9E729C